MYAKKKYIWNPARCSCLNGKYLGSINDDWVITSDEIINAAYSVSINVMSTVLISFLNKNVRYKTDYILHTVLLVIILLCNCCYLLSLSKTLVKTKKLIAVLAILKLENTELKNVSIKNCTSYYFDDIIKLKDFNFDNISLDEKSYANISIYDISYKTLIGGKSLHIRFHKIDRFIIVYDETRYLVLFGPRKYDAVNGI